MIEEIETLLREKGGSLTIRIYAGKFMVFYDNHLSKTYRSASGNTLKESLEQIMEPEKEDDLEWLTS